MADFQRDRYAAAKDILETFNGVIIADPVRLGKTYLALRLLDDYAYQLRQKVLVAVDECHNLRNKDANRWQNLARLLTTGKPKKLILLAATPINTSVFDLYNQLRLLTRDRNDYFAGVGIPDLFQYFRQAEENRESLHDLLETIAVRRSRDFRRNYPKVRIDGRTVHFPERKLRTVSYNLQQTYEGLYADVAQAIENLRLAPYLLDFYKAGIPRPLRPALTGPSAGDPVRDAEPVWL